MNKSFCFFEEWHPKVASWSLERENNSSDCCSWDGVECDHYTGHVISLDLSDSCLFGSMNSNSSLFRLLQLQRFNLAFNDFNSSQISFGVGNLSRSIQNSLNNHTKLLHLDLSGMLLMDVPWLNIAHSNGTLSKIEYLRLNSLGIRKFPNILLKHYKLVELWLSSNNLQGLIPGWMYNVSNLSYSLQVLGLRSNNFDGTIPNTWQNDCKLQMIDLSQNQLEGQMPSSLANCASNTESNDSMLELHILDLSNNNFSENLPASNLLQSNAMKIVGANKLQYMGSRVGYGDDYSVTITNKDIELEYKKIKDDLTFIDFSCNGFEGKIPELLGNLIGLRVLNLSNNALTGPIPLSLGNLTQLESLDLSHNMLSGEIPRQLAQLTYLVVFDVSYNDFTGPIPHGNQFKTYDNTSFRGNQELCGRPSSKMCENFKYSPIPPTFGKDCGSESLFNFGWKIVAIGYASGFVIGVIIGQLVYARHPNWFMKTFGKKQQP
ncbi:Receptor-like protein 12 [Morella rubra]|uniref:Receptor-like protein 12 n=1 Tax=Morella rubra TaxID=262757 RepID=A0A6A1WMD7_9ROSI|nr:Receptor-like protein 12 [Morella rubra]